jgi:hypothetical protein
MNPLIVSYKKHRFLPQIIVHAVWLHFRFPLSLRLVEEMFLERGFIVSCRCESENGCCKASHPPADCNDSSRSLRQSEIK